MSDLQKEMQAQLNARLDAEGYARLLDTAMLIGVIVKEVAAETIEDVDTRQRFLRVLGQRVNAMIMSTRIPVMTTFENT